MHGPARVPPPGEDRTESLLAEAGWLRLLDQILARLSHDLNGRAMALDAIVHFVDAGRPVPPVFRQEVGRVQELAEVLALIPSSIDSTPIPVILSEALLPALRLHQSMAETNPPYLQIDVAGSTPPVLVAEGRFLRAMVIYLSLLDEGAEGHPWLRVTGDETMAEIRGIIEPGDAHQAAWTALADVFSLDSGQLFLEDGECVLQLPSLSVARAAKKSDEPSGVGRTESSG